jgi:two-component system cell cycle sensor histidine kinase/response regulator CckA
MTHDKLHIVFVEDSELDVELEERELRKAGLQFTSRRVETSEDLLAELTGCKADLIISDYTLPRLDGLTALRLSHKSCPDTPFIFVSGTIGEDRAANSLKEGATDYVVKGRLNRLAHVVQRALQEAKDRIAHRTLEEQLRQSQKMEAIGRLAGGVAHDFNNMLTVITGYSQIALERIPPDSPLYEFISEILKAGDRAAALTKQLLAFSRKQVLQHRILDLNATVSDMERMLRRIIGDNIVLATTLTREAARIKTDPGQVEQVILNLAINARDAMPEGGRLTIATARVNLDEAYVKNHPEVHPGDYILLEVTDTGIGMSEEIQSHIFEPFFTTKLPGLGTGLGLSTVFGIVAQSGGHIVVESEPGKGACFRVYFPWVADSVQDGYPVLKPPSTVSGTETVLLVEDEEIVRKLARSVLENKGYTVLEAPNGAAAIAFCNEYPGPIHLLITDIMMPEMSGRELAVYLRASKPKARIIYMSGYAEDAVAHHGALDRETPFLPKPFSMIHLLTKVREVLDSAT